MAAQVWRIRDRATFATLRRDGRRCRKGPLTVVYAPAGEGTVPRVGYAIGRSVGGAVVRNRIRRQLRSALVAAHLAPGAYLIVASPAAATLGFEALRSALTEAAHSAAQSAVQPVTV